jgi:hypothetical protein
MMFSGYFMEFLAGQMELGDFFQIQELEHIQPDVDREVNPVCWFQLSMN